MGEIPRAIDTQRTGVNLRVEVARSHMPASIESRGHTDNLQIGDDEERSALGNVFRRLGRGQTFGTL